MIKLYRIKTNQGTRKCCNRMKQESLEQERIFKCPECFSMWSTKENIVPIDENTSICPTCKDENLKSYQSSNTTTLNSLAQRQAEKKS